MTTTEPASKADGEKPAAKTPPDDKAAAKPARKMPPEIGGPPGPEPTRYGDWQFKGRVTDF